MGGGEGVSLLPELESAEKNYADPLFCVEFRVFPRFKLIHFDDRKTACM